jgi:hypothetical protein
MKFDISLQKQLIIAVLDDFTPNGILPSVFGGQYGDDFNNWKKSVMEFILTFYKVKLLEILPCKEGYHNFSTVEIEALLNFGDYENGIDNETLWDILYFRGTNNLNNILDNLDLNSWDAFNGKLCPQFCEKLMQIGIVFEK